MKGETRNKPDVWRNLQFVLTRRIRRPLFILSEYRFFSMGEGRGRALSLSLPRFLYPLSLLFHVIESQALALIRLPCYLVKLAEETVGLFAFQELPESLLVASLAVDTRCRRLGIGTFILEYLEKVARRLNKKWLEVDVLRKNLPARRLYASYGFRFIQSAGNPSIMRGRKLL